MSTMNTPPAAGKHGDLDLCGSPSRDGACKNRAGFKTVHVGWGPCIFHGGHLPTVMKKWQRELAEAEVVQFGLPIDVDPQDALLAALYESYGHAAWLRERLEQEGDVTSTIVTTGTSSSGGDWERSETVVNIYKQLWDEERKQSARLAAACIKAGIAEREVRLAERQADILVSVISRILDDPRLQLTPEQRLAGSEAAQHHLRAVAS